jgi:phosphatidylserine decarboxylase
VYQAFLSAFFYHRWHAPVSGTIVKAYLVDGTYYSDADAEGYDPSSLNDSQGGMAEVSSCMIDALPGQRVRKGEELGYFQYARSTYCLIFRPGVIESFVRQPPFDDKAPPIQVNAPLCTAR